MTEGRALSRNETHDLGMIIKDRAKVLKAHVDHQGAKLLADFETQMATIYDFDDDDVWKKAAAEAFAVGQKCQELVAERCRELGIPDNLAPSINVIWAGRGRDAMKERQAELRRTAKAKIEEMSKHAVLKIEQQSLDLRTQVVSMGLVSDDAKLFLESLAPVEEAMKPLMFADIEKKLVADKEDRRRALRGY